jgi:hypothetical protein
MLKYYGVSCLVLYILLNQMAAFVFSNFSLVFLWLLIFAYWASYFNTCTVHLFFILYCDQQMHIFYVLLTVYFVCFVF